MQIGQLTTEYDIFDLDTAEAYETALKNMEVSAADERQEGTLSEQIRRQCAVVFDFFDDALWDGAHKEIFGARTNLNVCLETFQAFIEAVQSQKEAFEAKVTTGVSRAPTNREQRRAATRRPRPE